MIEYYLAHITFGWFDRQDLPPETVAQYGPFLRNILSEASNRGHIEVLRQGLKWAVAQPDLEALGIDGGRYPHSHEELLAICHYVLEHLPGDTLDNVVPTDVINENAYTWNERDRGRLPKRT
jgi:hypothetical protein